MGLNSLAQRVYVELVDAGHNLAVGVVRDADDMAAAVESFPPDVIVAPYLKSIIPESIWRTYTCLIVHPGQPPLRSCSEDCCAQTASPACSTPSSVSATTCLAATVLKAHLAAVSTLAPSSGDTGDTATYREVWYEEHNDVGYLHFEFYNGAMSTQQCRTLRDAYLRARERPTRVIVLMGGQDLWSNVIDLNAIEAATSPERESWVNIHAMNDVVREIITTNSHWVISALAGNAGAGGAPLALAADEVYTRSGIVLNPHYKKMGPYGSEYWTYLLPRQVGDEWALDLTESRLPIDTRMAKEIGLIDGVFDSDLTGFRDKIRRFAESLTQSADFGLRLHLKRQARQELVSKRQLVGFASRFELSHRLTYSQVRAYAATGP